MRMGKMMRMEKMMRMGMLMNGCKILSFCHCGHQNNSMTYKGVDLSVVIVISGYNAFVYVVLTMIHMNISLSTYGSA